MVRASVLARRYAEAYFALAQDDGDIAGWREQLAGSSNPGEPGDQRCAGKSQDQPCGPRQARARCWTVRRPARNLARLLIERRRVSARQGILAYYDALTDKASGIVRAEVITAVPADAALDKQIRDSLSKQLGSDVQTTVRTDPSIIGGLVIRIGDRVIDDSLRTHLQQLQAALA